jgi:hypothetical protein
MAQLNSGIKFDSDLTSPVPSSATFSQLRASDNANDDDFLATQAGAMVISLRPEAQSSAKTVPLIEGKFLDLSMEYSNDGANVRFLLKPEGGTSTPTAYVPANAPHTLALSYDAKNGGSLLFALDGVGSAVPGAFGANINADTSKSVVFAPSQNFDGHLSAIAFFQEFLSQDEVTRLSNDPEAWIDNLSSYNAPELNWPVPTHVNSNLPALTGLLGGNALAELEPVTITGQGVQVLTIKPGLSAGDKISLSVPNAGYSERSYTVLSSDLSAANPPKAVAESLVKSMGGQLGTDVVLNYGNTASNAGMVVITGSNDFLAKPVSLKFTNTAQVTESALQYLYDFRLDQQQQQSLTTPVAAGLDPNDTNSGTLDAGNVRVSLAGQSIVEFRQGNGTSTVVTPAASGFTAASAASTGGEVSNGPIYAQIKSVVVDPSDNTKFNATYNLFIDPGFDSGGFNTFGFTARTSETFKDFIPAPFTDARVNNALQSANEITVQWLKTTPVTDYSKSIGELIVQLDSDPGATLTFSNISVDSNFFTNTDGSPLKVAEGVITDRHQLTGVVKQLPYSADQNSASLFVNDAVTDNLAATLIDPIPLANTIASYEVADAAGSYGAKLRLKTPLNPAEKASNNTEATMTAVFEVVVQPNTTAYDLKLELPYNASNVTWAPVNGGTGAQQGRLFDVVGTTTSSTSEKVIGELSVDLDMAYGLGVDFDFATAQINGQSAVGRLTHVGVAKANNTAAGEEGKFLAKNLPVGDVKVVLLDTTTVKTTSKITLEDARAVLNLAAVAGQGATTDITALQPLGYAPSDLLAADFNKDGRVTSADALEIIKYVAQVNKTVPLEYIFLDNINNDPSATANYAGGLTNVINPPMQSRLSNEKYINETLGTALTSVTKGVPIGDGPTIHYVGVLIGDVV